MSLFGELYKKEEISINIALAFECMHNSALILDDIFDNAEYRNGKKCTYLAFSKPTAILVSSYLIFKGFQFLGQMKDHVDYENFIRIHQIFVSYSQNIIKGAFEKNTLRAKEHTKENYFDVLNATASHITSVGFKAIATVITDDPHFIINAQKFGSYLGCLLQIKNDILDIYGYESNDYTLQDIKNNDPNILISLLSRYANENISCENVYGIIDRNNIKNEALYIAENYYKGCVDCIPKLV
jgi:geranylgeranyl pyrophosphate synthase